MITEVAALSARLRVAVVQYEKKKYYYKNQNTHTPSCTRQSVAASWPQVDTEHRQHTHSHSQIVRLALWRCVSLPVEKSIKVKIKKPKKNKRRGASWRLAQNYVGNFTRVPAVFFCFMFMPPKQLIKCKLDEHVRRDARPGCAANSAYDLRNVQRQKIIENYQDKARNFTIANWPIVMLMRRSQKKTWPRQASAWPRGYSLA